MSERAIYDSLLWGAFALAGVTATYLCFVAAPYGRHVRKGYGPTINNTASWLLMEAPASLVPLALVFFGGRFDAVTLVFLAVWQLHYVQRAFVYPLLIRGRGARVPLLVPISGALFNVLNGYLNFRYLTRFAAPYPLAWLWDTRFMLGALLFVAGYIINRQSDRILRSLRTPGESGYKIPHGGLYRWVSCPNYLGELIAWCGWALLTWSLPGLFFAAFTAANLVPRALSHHRDYKRRFESYPPERRAILPYLL
jgi:3-oxo-5-alpha-steroid 4-dehydrogenase 1